MEVGVNRATEGSHPSIDLPGCSLSHSLKGMLRTFPIFVLPVEEAVLYWSRLVEEKLKVMDFISRLWSIVVAE